jgi:hypothetical protein
LALVILVWSVVSKYLCTRGVPVLGACSNPAMNNLHLFDVNCSP